MTIKNVTVNRDHSVTLVDDTGNVISMSASLTGVLREQLVKMEVRDNIRYTMEGYDGDFISLCSLDITEDEFIEEVFSTFEEEIEVGNYPNENDIQEAVLYTADLYGICID